MGHILVQVEKEQLLLLLNLVFKNNLFLCYLCCSSMRDVKVTFVPTGVGPLL